MLLYIETLIEPSALGKIRNKKEQKATADFQKDSKPLSEREQVRGLTYQYLEKIGVPKWGSGTFRYISAEAANTSMFQFQWLDGTFHDPEEFWDIEGRGAGVYWNEL